MNDFKAIWDKNLISSSGGVSVSVGDLVLVLLLIAAGYLLSRLAEFVLAKRLQKTDLRPDSVHVIKRLIFYAILLMVLLTALSLLGIPITAFAFATGAIAIGIGFGAQNIINNFISGWILMAERPIRVDDFIEVEGYIGTVKRVGTRSTLVHRIDGVHVLVPNSKLLENTVVNWTLVDGLIRNSIRVGVAYGSDLDTVLAALKAAVAEVDDILDEPQTDYVFEDFGDSALIFDILFWSDMTCSRPLRLIRSQLRFAVSRKLEEAGITISFPQRDLHLHSSTPLQIQMKSQDES